MSSPRSRLSAPLACAMAAALLLRVPLGRADESRWVPSPMDTLSAPAGPEVRLDFSGAKEPAISLHERSRPSNSSRSCEEVRNAGGKWCTTKYSLVGFFIYIASLGLLILAAEAATE